MKVSLKCYKYGTFVGKAKAYRKWLGGKFGPAEFWYAEGPTGGWLGSGATREHALAIVFGE